MPSSDKQKQRHGSKATDIKILVRCFGYTKPHWRLALVGYSLLVVINVIVIIIPQLMRGIVDRGIEQRDLEYLTWSVLALLGLTVVRGVLSYFQGNAIERTSQNVAYDLRNELYQKLSSLSFSYHDRTEAGQLLARAMQDVDRLRFLNGRATMRFFEGSVLLIITVVVLAAMNVQLALLSLLSMPVLLIQAYRYSKNMRPLWRSIRSQVSSMTSWVEQNLRGARIVKGFAQEEAEIARFNEQNDTWFELAAQSALVRAVNDPAVVFLTNISTIFIIWSGGRLVIQGGLTMGEFVAFTAYLSQLAGRVRMLGRMVPFVTEAAASGERIFEILDAESDVKESPDAIELPEVEGRVRFEDVSFAYFGRRTVLDGINLEVAPGQIIALLGATGSGKSTIINLIPRFYDVTKGRVTIDGHDVRDLTLESLRRQIGIVLQETTLFAASIRENIEFGRPDASDEEVIEAARAAQAHDFIMAMPDGYETQVGERGSTLSGGQKQRIAIARALLKDPRILILDDAMSSVDTETERLIQKALERLMRGRTSFVIAQRLSTVRMANLIVVLDSGHIVARGTHGELLARSGLYADIYERQLRPQEVQKLVAQPQVDALSPALDRA
ncbi:MAG: ABC transporter ATP-binding protein [Anaerolineae bacterium]|nr:ABC transporter ATP-binding protein [Anaerolineae bacterium]